MEESESVPVLGGRQSKNLRWNRLWTCFSNFKWLVFIAILLGQLIGLTLFTIWAVDCFFREFRTTANCEHFHLFPTPKIFEIFWLFSSSLASVFLIYHVVHRTPTFYGPRRIFRHLILKKYFYKISFVLLVVVVYDIYVITNGPETLKTVVYFLFIMEKSLTAIFMFLVNFLPRFWNRGESSLKRWGYKAALAMYVLQNYLVALLGSTIAAYKVLSVPESKSKTNDLKPPGAKSVVALMLLITNNGFRYFVAEFFLTKMFDKNLDILGGKTIEESMGGQILEVQEDDDHSTGSHRMNVTPTPEQERREEV